MLAESSVGHGAVGAGSGAPTLMLLGSDDDVATTAVQRAAYDTMCQEGHTITAVECEGLGHVTTLENTLDMQLQFLIDRTTEVPFTDPTCGAIVSTDCAGSD